MVGSLRSALLICAAMSASSVAPAQVGPGSEPLVPFQSAISSSAVVQDLLRNSDQLAIPPAAEEPQQDEDSAGPEVDPAADLPSMVAALRSSDPGSRELECLAAGVYFESKGEPLSGQLAVAQVISNRAESGRFPDSYCGVLLQRSQFSFVRHGKWPHIRRDSRSWKTAVAIAKIVDQDLKESKVDDALYFHAKRVRPGWHKKRVASIGNHIFFR